MSFYTKLGLFYENNYVIFLQLYQILVPLEC